MTDPFETAVAEALLEIWWHPRAPVFGGSATVACLTPESVEHVAPRVAAAFLQTVDGDDVTAQNEFVAALRGTPP